MLILQLLCEFTILLYSAIYIWFSNYLQHSLWGLKFIVNEQFIVFCVSFYF